MKKSLSFNARCLWRNSMLTFLCIILLFLFSFESIVMAQGIIERVSISTKVDPLPIQGDVNCDNNVDFVDALFILQYVVGLRSDGGSCPAPDSNSLYAAAGDANNDNTITAVDALFILQCNEGISNIFCPTAEASEMMSAEESAAAAEVQRMLVGVGMWSEQPSKVFIPLITQ